MRLLEHRRRYTDPRGTPDRWAVEVRCDGVTVAEHHLSSWDRACIVYEACIVAIA